MSRDNPIHYAVCWEKEIEHGCNKDQKRSKPDDGVYLGVGTVRLPDGSRSAPGHFALMGPVGKWVGVDDFAKELK